MLKAVIVDDEPSVLEGLKIFVDWQKEGYEIVGEASDGLSAFPIICEKHPDLVICDIRMPGLNGLELLEKIRKTVSPVPKFLMLSGYSEFSYARKAMQLGAVGYLTNLWIPKNCHLSSPEWPKLSKTKEELTRKTLNSSGIPPTSFTMRSQAGSAAKN